MNATIQQDCENILKRVDMSLLKNKRVLVTGANGLLGQHLVSSIAYANRIKKMNCKVVCVSLHGPGVIVRSCMVDKNISFKKIDLTKPFHIRGTFDYVFHAAGYGQPSKFARDPLATIAVNVDATRKLLELAQHSKGTLVFFSSGEVYGEMPRGMRAFKESYAGNAPFSGPRAVYAASKRLGEALSLYYSHAYGVRVKIVRISHVYGPGTAADDHRVMSDFIRKAIHGKTIRLLDQGISVKTYGYVGDITAMVLFAAFYGKNALYNVGGVDTMSIRQLAERIGKQCGVRVEVPRQTSKAFFAGKDLSVMKLDLSRIKKEMHGFSFTPFSNGLRETIDWAKALKRR